jgi:Ca2+-binding EF-hand superfamily protein
MKLKTLIAVAAAFAVPLAQAAGDKANGAEKMFQALDKDNDGKLSREEHAAAPEHAGDKAAAGGTSGNKKY